MRYITFTYGDKVYLGRCSISSATDTTMTSYWTSDEDSYQDFTDKKLEVGEKIFYTSKEEESIYISRIANISATVITLTSNPGVKTYDRILQMGHIEPYVKRSLSIYSYPIDSYCGSTLEKSGEYYKTYSLTSHVYSDGTLISTNSVMSLYFKKGDAVDEIKLNIKSGAEMAVLKSLYSLFKGSKDIVLQKGRSSSIPDILGVNSVTSSFAKGDY